MINMLHFYQRFSKTFIFMLEILKFHFIISMAIAKAFKNKNKVSVALEKHVPLTIHLKGVTSFDRY